MNWNNARRIQMCRLIVVLLFAFLAPLSHTFLRAGTRDIDRAADPYYLMLKHYDAIGGIEELRSIVSSYSEGEIRLDGLSGTFRSWDEKPLRYRLETNLGVIHFVEGDSGEQAWQLDTNGQVLISKDPKTLERRQIRELIQDFEHVDPDSVYFTLAYDSIKTVDGRPCHVIIQKNTINSDLTHYYIDVENYWLRASKFISPDLQIFTVYGNFREIDRTIIPFYSKSEYFPRDKEEEVWVTKHVLNIPTNIELFSVPQPTRDYTLPQSQSSATIPFEFLDNLIYIPVTLCGETHPWLLDSGASMSVIDKDYALSLGLNIGGEIKGYGFGELFNLGFVSIPDYRVGEIHFQQQDIYVVDGLSDRTYEPVIYGILGYDFLSRFVVELDYDNKLAIFHIPESFTYKGEGITLQAPLKYRTFSLPVKVETFPVGFWSVDLGSHQSSIHYPYAKKHQLLERSGIKTVSQGVTGYSFGKLSRFGCLQIGSMILNDQVLTLPASSGKGSESLGEVDGNLGNSTLRHFHVFLHYPEQEIILEKGRQYNTPIPQDKSGMLIGRSAGRQPMVSYIDESGPAYKAGMRTGDILLSMDGIKLGAGYSVLAVKEVLQGHTGKMVTLQVLRKGRHMTTRFRLENLYSEVNNCNVEEKEMN